MFPGQGWVGAGLSVLLIFTTALGGRDFSGALPDSKSPLSKVVPLTSAFLSFLFFLSLVCLGPRLGRVQWGS